jgi:hypothetical protein
MKIIFLDMDGVVNSRDTFERARDDRAFKLKCLEHREVPYLIDPTLRERINEILRDVPDCKVVWSSTWRLGLRGSKIFIEGFYNQCGFEEFSFLGFTPSTHRGGPRYMEILEWLNTNGSRYNIEKCAIIDDGGDAGVPLLAGLTSKKLEQKYKVKFFKTEFARGITEEIKNKIKVYFLN